MIRPREEHRSKTSTVKASNVGPHAENFIGPFLQAS
jgi:hypothetical protein